MSTTAPNPGLWTICFTPKTYREEIEARGTEPRKRELRFVLHFLDCTWHLKLTFYGKLRSAGTSDFAKAAQRRKDLENLCLCIDFDVPRLLDDTVTELLLSEKYETHCRQLRLKKTTLDPKSEYTDIADNLWFCLREDPNRISRRYKNLVQAYTVYVDHIEYVYKAVDRPLYVPRDSDVLEQELQNLEKLQKSENIVRLVAAVVSYNPYQTRRVIEGDTPSSLQGVLLEYHPNGTLQHVLRAAEMLDIPWLRLAFQITCALYELHQHSISHMDLKPENIVLNQDLHAIIIDISGIGGTTRRWLSPEMRMIPEPCSQGLEARKQNDIWALGQIFSVISEATYNTVEQEALRNMSLLVSTDIPPRIPLQDVISSFSFSASALAISDIVPVDITGVKATVRAGT